MKERLTKQAFFPMVSGRSPNSTWTLVITHDSDDPTNLTFSLLWADNLDASHYVDIPIADIQTFLERKP